LSVTRWLAFRFRVLPSLPWTNFFNAGLAFAISSKKNHTFEQKDAKIAKKSKTGNDFRRFQYVFQFPEENRTGSNRYSKFQDDPLATRLRPNGDETQTSHGIAKRRKRSAAKRLSGIRSVSMPALSGL
jgi:hypothetical protein